jgi:putative hydrolase of the HAD superfamily
MIKAVLFDLDGTLLDRDASVEQFIAIQYDRLINHLSHISKSDYIARFTELDCHGHVWKDKVYQELVEEFKIKGLTWQMLLQDYEQQFQNHCIPFLGLVEMLILLKKQDYLLGIISNGWGEFQTHAIEGLGIKSYFDVILISDFEQIRKPQPEIFHRAAQRLGVMSQDCIFVGDNPEADIIGAKNAGMKTIWKRNLSWKEPKAADAMIDELHEIPTILKSQLPTVGYTNDRLKKH